MQGTIEVVDPRDLTIALNVRTDVKLDPEFVASIKELGVLQPPMVTATADGSGYEVVLGQRRTLAAVEAGLSEIPVYLVDKSEADAARVVDQLTENDQRQQLSEAERVGGYKQLSLFGISPADIAKRTSVKVERVQKALQVAEAPVVLTALEDHQLTLDQAAELVEFADDEKAVNRITAATAADERQFPHALQKERAARDLADARADLEQRIAAIPGVIVLEPAKGTWESPGRDDLVELERLGKPEDSTLDAEVTDVPEGSLAVRIARDHQLPNGSYGEWVKLQYFVVDHESVGIPMKTWKAREAAPEDPKVREAREAEDRKRAEERAARSNTEAVREQFLVGILQRKEIPADAMPLIALTLSVSDSGVEDTLMLKLLELPESLSGWQRERERAEAIAAIPPARAGHVALAAAFSVAEQEARNTYGRQYAEHLLVATYLSTLAAWGYALQPYELEIVDTFPSAWADGPEADEADSDEQADDEDAVA